MRCAIMTCSDELLLRNRAGCYGL